MKTALIICIIIIVALSIALCIVIKNNIKFNIDNIERQLIIRRISRLIDETDYKEREYNESKPEDKWQYNIDYKQIYHDIKEWLLTR